MSSFCSLHNLHHWGGICGHVDIPEMETALLVLCLLLSKVLQTGWLCGHRGCAIFFYGFKIHSSLYTYCNLHRYKKPHGDLGHFHLKTKFSFYFLSPQCTVHSLFWSTCFCFFPFRYIYLSICLNLGFIKASFWHTLT